MQGDQKTGDPLLDAIIEASIVPAGDQSWLMIMVLRYEVLPDICRGVTVQLSDDNEVESTAPFWARLKFTVSDSNVLHALIVPDQGVVMPPSIMGQSLSPFGEIVFLRGSYKKTLRNTRSLAAFRSRPVPTSFE